MPKKDHSSLRKGFTRTMSSFYDTGLHGALDGQALKVYQELVANIWRDKNSYSQISEAYEAGLLCTRIRQKELACRLDCSRSTIARRIRYLSDLGLIRVLDDDKNDARVYQLGLVKHELRGVKKEHLWLIDVIEAVWSWTDSYALKNDLKGAKKVPWTVRIVLAKKWVEHRLEAVSKLDNKCRADTAPSATDTWAQPCGHEGIASQSIPIIIGKDNRQEIIDTKTFHVSPLDLSPPLPTVGLPSLASGPADHEKTETVSAPVSGRNVEHYPDGESPTFVHHGARLSVVERDLASPTAVHLSISKAAEAATSEESDPSPQAPLPAEIESPKPSYNSVVRPVSKVLNCVLDELAIAEQVQKETAAERVAGMKGREAGKLAKAISMVAAESVKQVDANSKKRNDNAAKRDNLKPKEISGSSVAIEKVWRREMQSCYPDIQIAKSLDVSIRSKLKWLVEQYSQRHIENATVFLVRNWKAVSPKFGRKSPVPSLHVLRVFHDQLIGQAAKWSQYRVVFDQMDAFEAEHGKRKRAPRELRRRFKIAEKALQGIL